MASIRPLVHADVPLVAALLRRHLHGSFELHERFLAATLLDDPWTDSELPSLVAVDDDDDGELVGFIGAQVRRMRLGDRRLRGVCCAHLVVAPEHRRSAAGALLLRRLMAGPQDLTWSDTADDVVMRMWSVFGGYVDHTRACDWMLALRPLRWGLDVLSSLVRRRDLAADLMPVRALPLQAAGRRLLPRAFPPPDRSLTSEPASAGAIAEHAPAFADRGSIRPAYDADHLEHLFALVGANVGSLERRLVRRHGRPIGWYACVTRAGGGSRVLHLAALDADLDAVVGEVVQHARGQGGAVLSGRFEPRLEDALRRRLAVLGVARRPVVHARDPEIRDLLGRGSALITQLDGEWYAA